MNSQSNTGDNRIEIEFHDAESGASAVSESKRPNAERQGQVPAGVVATYIDAAVIEAVWRHVSLNRRTELGGVLIGHCAEDNGVFVRVTASLDARHTTKTAGSLTFTHKTWADLADRIGEQYAGSRVVGWYHSHPGHGVFMSRYDRFIHENFFRHPWQCAMVLDSVRGEEGLFQSVGGRIVRTGYWAVPRRPVRRRAVRRSSLVIDVNPDEHETLAEAIEQVVETVVQTLPSLLRYDLGGKVELLPRPGKHFDEKA